MSIINIISKTQNIHAPIYTRSHMQNTNIQGCMNKCGDIHMCELYHINREEGQLSECVSCKVGMIRAPLSRACDEK